MNLDKIVEELIKKAQERGEFDNLPGEGKPIDLTEYFETPEDIRVAQSVLTLAPNASAVRMQVSPRARWSCSTRLQNCGKASTR